MTMAPMRRRFAVGLDDGVEGTGAAGADEVDKWRDGAFGGAAVGIADLGGAGELQTELFGDGAWDHQSSGPTVERRPGG